MASRHILMSVLVAAGVAACSQAAEEDAPAPIPAPDCATTATAEEAAARPSPLDSVMMDLDGAPAKLCYSRPSARGRVIVGELDPFDAPWRMGANEPTTLHLTAPATVGGIEVDAGSYVIYAVPTETVWTVALNGNVDRWGVPITPEVQAEDVGSFEVTPTAPPEHVETMTFTFEPADGGGTLVFSFENHTFGIPIRSR